MELCFLISVGTLYNSSACLFISYITEIDLYNCLCSSTSWTHSNHFNGHIDTR